MKELIECVPNFSEGQREEVLSGLADIVYANGATLLRVDRGESANRSVFTFAGEPRQVMDTAFSMIRYAMENIDMGLHKGVHPRLGATDVCPLIPLQNVSIEQVKKYAEQLAQRVGNELAVPVYLYAESAKKNERRLLSHIRRGGYEAFANKMLLPEWQPDYGPAAFDPKKGVTVMGARNFLIAYNINIASNSMDVARKIASKIRTERKTNTVFTYVKAIGWYIEEFQRAQISLNIENFEKSDLYFVYKRINEICWEFDTYATGSELIGLIPLEALLNAAEHLSADQGKEEIALEDIIYYLGLNELEPFEPYERIIEYKMGLSKKS